MTKTKQKVDPKTDLAPLQKEYVLKFVVFICTILSFDERRYLQQLLQAQFGVPEDL